HLARPRRRTRGAARDTEAFDRSDRGLAHARVVREPEIGAASEVEELALAHGRRPRRRRTERFVHATPGSKPGRRIVVMVCRPGAASSSGRIELRTIALVPTSPCTPPWITRSTGGSPVTFTRSCGSFSPTDAR